MRVPAVLGLHLCRQMLEVSDSMASYRKDCYRTEDNNLNCMKRVAKSGVCEDGFAKRIREGNRYRPLFKRRQDDWQSK